MWSFMAGPIIMQNGQLGSQVVSRRSGLIQQGPLYSEARWSLAGVVLSSRDHCIVKPGGLSQEWSYKAETTV